MYKKFYKDILFNFLTKQQLLQFLKIIYPTFFIYAGLQYFKTTSDLFNNNIKIKEPLFGLIKLYGIKNNIVCDVLHYDTLFLKYIYNYNIPTTISTLEFLIIPSHFLETFGMIRLQTIFRQYIDENYITLLKVIKHLYFSNLNNAGTFNKNLTIKTINKLDFYYNFGIIIYPQLLEEVINE